MGKKNKAQVPLGRSLIKDRFNQKQGRKFVSENTMLHTTELHDGYDWGRLNLQSVTEESAFQEFLSTAELAGTEFQAEKLNIKFVNPRTNVGLPSNDEVKKTKDAHQFHKSMLKVPRRPPWNNKTTPHELDINERECFLEWRRGLANLQEEHSILLTPYEKNLEFWRQLWRVVERSDVVVQIVDARNPLLYWCEDLEKYVTELSENKINLILINKADFLTESQRQHWADYFTSVGAQVIFFSAMLALDESADISKKNANQDVRLSNIRKSIEELEEAVQENAEALSRIMTKLGEIIGQTSDDAVKSDLLVNSHRLLSRDELVEVFGKIHNKTKVTQNLTTIGLVGYPNVGKSSTINALLTSKKVSVSATPGKTKHFQTLFLNDEILLCDCPGLVMPSFVFTKAEMILNGILPIDQMRDHVPPTNLLTSLIPRHVIEDKYGIMLPLPMEDEDFDRNPTSEELLNSYAYNRGFMTANGQPDNPRAARYILKDFVAGKLLYCHAPPTAGQLEYHTWAERQKPLSTNRTVPPRELRATQPNRMTTDVLDKAFFKDKPPGVHIKGISVTSYGTISNQLNSNGNAEVGSVLNMSAEKPWKKIKKHENKNKREKLRRVYAHLDQQ